jgi:hypothetical protein
MSFEIASITYIEAEVGQIECIDMYNTLYVNGMWLILEGFVNGYLPTEDAVDRLHILLHQELGDRIN